jgi:hypothetical protein
LGGQDLGQQAFEEFPFGVGQTIGTSPQNLVVRDIYEFPHPLKVSNGLYTERELVSSTMLYITALFGQQIDRPYFYTNNL